MKKYALFIVCSILINFLNMNNVYCESQEKQKLALLTFDDGPSKTTLEVIKQLKELGVPGTFFVIGKSCETYKEEFKTLISSGYDVCVHTYDHDYKMYNSIENYMNDYTKCKTTIEEISGKKVSNFVRFPGGSSNRLANKSALKSIRNYIVDNGLNYVDWNISTEDALGRVLSVNEIIRNVKKEYKHQDVVIILMHDAYKNITTAKALPDIVKFLKDEGYKFKSLSTLEEDEFNMLVDNKLINKHSQKMVETKK